MYLTVRTYRGIGPPREVGARVSEGLVPVLRSLPGFRAYYAATTDSDAFSVSVFDSRNPALAANERTREWVAANLRDLLPNPPEVMGGEVIHEAVSARQEQGRDGWAAIWTFNGMGTPGHGQPKVQDTIAPLAEQPGFCRFYALASEAHGGRRVVVVSLFKARDAAVAAQGRLLEAKAEQMRDLFPIPPTVMGGEVLVIATV